MACWFGHLDMVTYLLGKNINIESIENDLIWIITTKKNHEFGGASDMRIAKYSPFRQYDIGCGKEHLQILKLLIGYNLRTPITNIFISCNPVIIDVEIINWLVERHGFDIFENVLMDTIHSYWGENHIKITNLLELSVYHKKIDVVKFLLEQGMDPRVGESNSVKIASEYNCLDIKNLLLEYC